MKKVKKIIVLCAAFVFIPTFFACAGAPTQGANNPDGGTFDIEEIQDEPASYVGTITLSGIVTNSDTQDFALQNETGTFEVLVDYNGSQALPQVGDRITVYGQLAENRPCCGPGFTLRSTEFELLE